MNQRRRWRRPSHSCKARELSRATNLLIPYVFFELVFCSLQTGQKIVFFTKKIITHLKILFCTRFIMHSIYIHRNHFCTRHILLLFIYPPSIRYYFSFHMSHCISLSISYLFLPHWLLKFWSSRPLFVLASDTICDTQIPYTMVYKTHSYSGFEKFEPIHGLL